MKLVQQGREIYADRIDRGAHDQKQAQEQASQNDPLAALLPGHFAAVGFRSDRQWNSKSRGQSLSSRRGSTAADQLWALSRDHCAKCLKSSATLPPRLMSASLSKVITTTRKPWGPAINGLS